MPDPSEIPESKLWELDALMKDLQDHVARNDLVYDAVEKALGEIARRFYPGIANWQPEDLNRLADRISRAAHNYCVELGDMDYRSTKDEKSGA